MRSHMEGTVPSEAVEKRGECTLKILGLVERY